MCEDIYESMPSMPSLYTYIAVRSLRTDHACACPPTRRTLAASLAWPTAAHANIWPKYFTDFSQIFHRFGATGFTDFSQIFYRFGALDSQIFHRFFTDFSQIFHTRKHWIHRFFTDSGFLDSQIFHRFFTEIINH